MLLTSPGPLSGGRASRDKGNRLERAIVRLLQDYGIGAERVPLSGSAGGSSSGDLSVPVLGRDLVIEAKARARGFAQLYSWLEGRDALIVKADRRDALVVLPLKLATEIAVAAEGVQQGLNIFRPDPKAEIDELVRRMRGNGEENAEV